MSFDPRWVAIALYLLGGVLGWVLSESYAFIVSRGTREATFKSTLVFTVFWPLIALIGVIDLILYTLRPARRNPSE